MKTDGRGKSFVGELHLNTDSNYIVAFPGSDTQFHFSNALIATVLFALY